MPDVVRSDSQRSDTSLRPRVSFNRDVHVKRIVPRPTALGPNENNYSIVPSVRKEHTRRPKKEFLEKPSRQKQTDKLSFDSKSQGISDKFYTLPRTRKEYKEINEFMIDSKPPKKPQRIFASQYKNEDNKAKSTTLNSSKNSTKKSKRKDTNLHRSASDAAHFRSKLLDNSKDHAFNGHDNSLRHYKKQLTPIAELTPRHDYFSPADGYNHKQSPENGINIGEQKEEILNKKNKNLRNENSKKGSSKHKNDKIIVIDIDKAEDISQSKKSKLKSSLFGRKLKSFTNKKNKKNDKIVPENSERQSDNSEFSTKVPSSVQRRNEDLDEQHLTEKMIHSSQKPADKLPLTKGTVDSMVRRLNRDTSSPPPKPNVMIIPNHSNQHNNNQPFSYTRGLSPDKYTSDETFTSTPGVPIIYAQVVCNNDRNGFAKQTVHTTFPKRYSQSDSDEGLGNDEVPIRSKHRSQKPRTHFGDEFQTKHENSTNSKVLISNSSCDRHFPDYCDCDNFFTDSYQRGCGDGMESKKAESFLENVEMERDRSDSFRNNIRTRRDLLESRITKKIHDQRSTDVKFEGSVSSSPITQSYKKYGADLERPSFKYYSTDESKSFDSQANDFNSSFRENKELNNQRVFEMKSRTMFTKAMCKSTPEIYHNSKEQLNDHYSFHNSLQRDRYKTNRMKTEKDKLGDSGIETDIKRDLTTNLSSKRSELYSDYNHIESEDEGFASSLLIASEKQHTEDNINKTLPKKNYESDVHFSGEDDSYHYLEEIDQKISRSYNDQFVPRERSIDDGSHYDPRIDKEMKREQSTLKRNAKKPPKPEKRSGLEKMKQLFSRDSKKKSKEKNEMVREESLLARYTEYKGSNDNLDRKDTLAFPESKSYHPGTRKRMSTPSVNSNQSHEVETARKNNNLYSNWFKSLDRTSRKTNKKESNKPHKVNTKEHEGFSKDSSPKNLRFFGDTDSESGDNLLKHLGSKSHISRKGRVISQSSRELHNISEEISHPEQRNNGYKSMLNISERSKDRPRRSQKPAAFSRSSHDVSADDRRKKYEHSSLESSLEGDGSQQSQRSVVYLHAATVGDIPAKYGQRAASKEELSDSSRMQTQTLSRSFSVLAPWKPRYVRESRSINYYQQPPVAEKAARKDNARMKNQEARDTGQKKTALSRTFRSKENLIKKPEEKTSRSSTLYKRREQTPRESSRYNKDESKMAAKCQSFESLGRNDRSNKRGGERSRDISRSVSMPKDPEKVAGWYKNKKKDNYRSEYIMQRV